MNEILEKGIEIIKNDVNSLVGIGPVRDFNSDSIDWLEDLGVQDEWTQITNPNYKNQWTSARWLTLACRQMLSEPDIKISKNEFGKPFLKESKLHISLSHNPSNAAVIFSKNQCGIDIEQIRDKIVRIERKFLSEEELDLYSGNIEILTLIWSAKESAYKMLNTPGVIFKEELFCKLNNDQSLELKIDLKNGLKLSLLVDYKISGNQILTYTELADTL